VTLGRRLDPVILQDPGDCGAADRMPQVVERALDAAISPDTWDRSSSQKVLALCLDPL